MLLLCHNCVEPGLTPNSPSFVESLNLNNNKFTGTIPTVIGSLRSVEYLSIEGNNMVGQIPVEIGLLTNLRKCVVTSLFACGESLVRPCAHRARSCHQTETLNLASNSLVGSIPNLVGLTELANLYLYRNQLTGQLPSGLFDLRKLGEFNRLCDGA